MKLSNLNSQSKKKKTVLLSTLIGLVLLVGLSTYFIFIKPQVEKSPDDTTTPSLEIDDKPVGDVNYDAPSPDEENPALDPPTNTSPEPGSSIPVSITYAGGSPVQVRVLIGEVLSTGTCTLIVSKGSSQVTSQTVSIFNASNTTTCQGFSIDSGLFSSGSYKITVTVTSNSREGTASREMIF